MAKKSGSISSASQEAVSSPSSAAKSAAENGKRKSKKRSAKTGVCGKKDKYHRLVADKLTLIAHWKRMGWTDEEVSKRLGIAYSTFKLYKGKYAALSAALRAGKEEADAEVENALFHKACGMKETVKKPIKVKEVLYENGKRVKEIERIEYGEEEVFVPPDVTADMFYLKHRVPERWGEQKPHDDERKTGVILIPSAD